MSKSQIKEWVSEGARRDELLYEQYGKPLEKDHPGEYVAISTDGRTILGSSTHEVLSQAVEEFGAGNFALAKVGHSAVWKWLRRGMIDRNHLRCQYSLV